MIRRALASKLARWTFIALAVGLAVAAVVHYWDAASAAFAELSVATAVVAMVAVLLAIGGSLLSWRRLLTDLGSPLPVGAATRVFALSQLGKYIPGSVWAFVAQVELAREHGVPRKRSAAAGVLVVAVSLLAALTIAAATLPFVADAGVRTYWWTLGVIPVLIAALSPAVLNPVLNWLLRLARREPLEHPLTLRGIASTLGWCAAAWLLFGAHIFVLARDVSGSDDVSYLAATGAFALAWSAGFVVVIAPAGAGIREVILAAVLSTSLDTGEVVVVVLLSRLLLTVGDLAWAGLGVLLGRAHAAAVPAELTEAEALRASARAERETGD